MDWQQELRKKLISPEQAAQMVKSGDLVVIPTGREPTGLGYSLAARKGQLRGVRILPGLAGRDFGWYDVGWEDSFSIETIHVMPLTASGIAERRFDFVVPDLLMGTYFDLKKEIDVLLLVLSPPDEHGYCSFGGSIWFKKSEIECSKLVLAEIYPHQIRTYGDNFVHMSKIDYFTEHLSAGKTTVTRDMLGRAVAGPGEVEERIAKNVSALIKDGDTIQIGAGQTTEYLPRLGAFDNKNDLGIFTEVIPGGLIQLVEKGIFTGARKTLHRGRAVGTAIGGGAEEYAIVNQNPAFELYGADYIVNPRIIAANDNMVAINTALSLDLTGQIAVDSLGYRMIAGVGGQLAFATGAQMSKGGRYVVALPSRASSGESRIVSSFDKGTVVSVPRTLADYIVTEYGIASLRGKSQRRRAEELIAIAHPDLRAELSTEARKIFWP